MIPNDTRLMGLARLLAASVGPLAALQRCQFVICVRQARSVRPSLLSSGLNVSSCRSRESSSRVSSASPRSPMRWMPRRVSVACQASKGLASGVACGEQAAQLRSASLGDALGGLEQQPPCPVEVVVGGASSAGGLVGDAAPHVVDGRVGELDDMERVRDLDGVGHGVAERLAVGPRQAP